MKIHSLVEEDSLGKNSCFLVEWKELRILLDCPLDTLESCSSILPFDRFSTAAGRRQRNNKEKKSPNNKNNDSNNDKSHYHHHHQEHQYLNASHMLFQTPFWDSVVDWEDLDLILISQENNALALPYITQYNSGFDGKIYATEPVVEMMRFLMEELVSLCPPSVSADLSFNSRDLPESLACRARNLLSWKCIYSMEDIANALEKIESVRFDQEIKFQENILLVPLSSGCSIGSCNWLIKVDQKTLFYLADASFIPDRYPMPFSIPSSHRIDYLLVSRTFKAASEQQSPESQSLYLSSIKEVADVAIKNIHNGGNVIIPFVATGIILDVMEALYSRLGSIRERGGILVVSPSANKMFQYANISGEWMNPVKCDKLYIPEDPMLMSELLQNGKVKDFEDVASGFGDRLKTPSIIFANHPSLRFGDIVNILQAWKGNPKDCLILTGDHDIDYALGPYQPMAMKTIKITCNASFHQKEVAKCIMETFDAGSVLVPADFDARLLAPSALFTYSFGSVLHVEEDRPEFVPSLFCPSHKTPRPVLDSGNATGFSSAALKVVRKDNGIRCEIDSDPRSEERTILLSDGPVSERDLVRLLKQEFGLTPIVSVSQGSITFKIANVILVVLEQGTRVTLKAKSMSARQRILDLLLHEILLVHQSK